MALAEPLVEGGKFLESAYIEPFYVSFILVLLATNARTAMAAILAAKQKRHHTTSLISPRLRIEIRDQKNIDGTRIVETRKINIGKMIQIGKIMKIKENLATMRRIGQEETRIRSIGRATRMI